MVASNLIVFFKDNLDLEHYFFLNPEIGARVICAYLTIREVTLFHIFCTNLAHTSRILTKWTLFDLIEIEWVWCVEVVDT